MNLYSYYFQLYGQQILSTQSSFHEDDGSASMGNFRSKKRRKNWLIYKPLIYNVGSRAIKRMMRSEDKQRKLAVFASSLFSVLLAECLTDGGWQMTLNEVSDTLAVTCVARKSYTWVTIPQHLECPSDRDAHVCQLSLNWATVLHPPWETAQQKITSHGLFD